MGWRWADGCRGIGITPKTSYNYRMGITPVPLYVQLAMSALTMGLQPWGDYRGEDDE
jgi:hypothetical protein